eukprot:Clim_evm25s153 gene=Clim_evmTU25s153
MANTTGLVFGLNKGKQVTKRERVARHAERKGKMTKERRFVKDLIREVAGFAPYERRMMELLRVGKDKRALKLAKKRLGTHTRGKNKREELTNILAAQRKAGH